MALTFSFGDLPFAFTTERVTDPDQIESIRKHGPGGGFFPRQWWDLTEDKALRHQRRRLSRACTSRRWKPTAS